MVYSYRIVTPYYRLPWADFLSLIDTNTVKIASMIAK